MDPFRTILTCVLLGLMPSCEEASGPMLHQMNSYAGRLTVTPEVGPPWSCDLAFDRRNGNLQAKRRTGERVVTLVRGADGTPSAFEKAAERSATPEEAKLFELVRGLTDKQSIQAVRPGEKTYRVRLGDAWLRIELESQTGTRIHGHPR